jgi:hypothetical protein
MRLPYGHLLTVALCLAAAGHIEAQRRLPSGAAFIGQVVDVVGGGRGVDRALVTVTSDRVHRQILTDTRGRFLLSGLPDGDYVLTAARHGFLDGAFGQRRSGGSGHSITLAAGQWLTGVALPVWRPAVITGLVTDADGDAVEGARVQAFRRRYVDGQATLTLVATDTTDDTGAYRLSHLHADDHVVRLDVGVRRYYPSATRPSQGLVITPQAGRDTVGIDFFTSVPGATSTLHGRVTTDAASTTVVPGELRLAEPPDPDLWLSDADRTITRVVVDEAQQFVVDDVVPGDYVVEVDGDDGGWIRHALEVNEDRSPDALVLDMHPGLEVRGSYQFARTIAIRPLPTTSTLVTSLTRADGSTPDVATGRVVDGRLLFGPLRPGAYTVAVSGIPAGWSVAAIDAAGEDALSTPLQIRDDHVVPVLTITLIDQSTAVSGFVRNATGQADGDATVVIFSASSAAGSSARPYTTRASRFGHFTVTHLPPGNYFIAAIDDADSVGWESAARRPAIRRGASSLTLKPGETKIVDLKRLNLSR